MTLRVPAPSLLVVNWRTDPPPSSLFFCPSGRPSGPVERHALGLEEHAGHIAHGGAGIDGLGGGSRSGS